jgi:hypothetical protein
MGKNIEINKKLSVRFEPVGVVRNEYFGDNSPMALTGDFLALQSDSEYNEEQSIALSKYFVHGSVRDDFQKKFSHYLGMMYMGVNNHDPAQRSVEILKRFHKNGGIFTQQEMVQLLDDLQGFNQHLNHVLKSQLVRKIADDNEARVEEYKAKFENTYVEYIHICNMLIKLVMKCIKNFNLSVDFDDEYHGDDIVPLAQNER